MIPRVGKKPTWGTCAGLILLCEEASAAKRGGQELIGGLDVRVHRNHFGRQVESFVSDLDLPFISKIKSGPGDQDARALFPAVFIRAPVVDEVLVDYALATETGLPESIVETQKARVEILATLPGRHASNKKAAMRHDDNGGVEQAVPQNGAGDIIALRQGNVFGTSFHPELTEDIRMHIWWLNEVARHYVH